MQSGPRAPQWLRSTYIAQALAVKFRSAFFHVAKVASELAVVGGLIKRSGCWPMESPILTSTHR
jgi:hypothetical protein